MAEDVRSNMEVIERNDLIFETRDNPRENLREKIGKLLEKNLLLVSEIRS